MEYKRLTEKVYTDDDGTCEYSCYASVRETNNRLGKLEDKIENGTLIKLPCPKHTMVYIICCHRKKYIIIETPFTYDMIDSYQCNWFVGEVYHCEVTEIATYNDFVYAKDDLLKEYGIGEE